MTYKIKKYVILLLLISVFTSGGIFEKKFNTGIVFNKEPFTRETAGNITQQFSKGERIYWLFMSKKPIKANFIKVQVVSSSLKSPFFQYMAIVYTHDYKIDKNSPHYFTDYFVMQTNGHYFMEIFDKNNLHMPITVADFYVK